MSIEKAAKILMYTGPNLNELTKDAFRNGHIVVEKNINPRHKIVEIQSRVPYDLLVSDVYYSYENKIYRHELVVNNKTHILFNKFKDADKALNEIEVKNMEAYIM